MQRNGEHGEAMTFESVFRDFARRHLGRDTAGLDGLPAAVIDAAEASLGLRLPQALRAYYRVLGSVEVLNRGHNRIFGPEELTRDEGYLVFMDENQSVVLWGIRVEDCELDEPEVWQRNNTPPEEWYSEEKNLTELLDDMFRWYRTIGVL
jgi:hypothetical protein